MFVNGKQYRSVWFEKDKIKVINQLLLPHKFEIAELKSVEDVAGAIKTMVVRGAPTIGATGAYGIALAVVKGKDPSEAAETLRNTRPTANDLFRGIDHVLDSVKNIDLSHKNLYALNAANEYVNRSVEACRRIGEHGKELIKDNFRILTHCNAGWLACVDWGTALAPIYFAKKQGKKIFVYSDETRPTCQGIRLTSWELVNEGIPHAVIVDNAAGYFMQKGEVDMVITGADRIAKNGDVANQIGTYEKAVLAKENGIPFYVAAPFSTFDLSCKTGKDIPIEERNQDEVLCM
ncbi:MAG: S-methyl-5-thioribose-1-phosphate isomerase, partial [Candidatus Aenigmarchaeota archaeon]